MKMNIFFGKNALFSCVYEKIVVPLQPEREKRSSNVDTTRRYSANYASNL